MLEYAICLGGETMSRLGFYAVDRLYCGNLNGKLRIAYLLENKIGGNAFVNPGQIVERLDNFEILDQLAIVLKQNDLDILITDVNGNAKNKLSLEEIAYLLKILDRKINLSLVTAKKADALSKNVACVISDLLGFNVNVNPSTYDFSGIMNNEILISAKKLSLFKRYMKDYTQASLIAENTLIFSCTTDSRDYRISRALNKARIPLTKKLCANTFSLRVDRSGKIMVNGSDLDDYKKEKEVGFQKVIKF